VLAQIDAKLEAGEAAPKSVRTAHDDSLERTVQTQFRYRAQGGAGARRHDDQEHSVAMRERSQPRPDRVAQRDGRHENQPADPRAQQNIGRASDLERFANGNDENSLEEGPRCGERGRVERSIVEDRNQAFTSRRGYESGRDAPSPGRSFERSDTAGGEAAGEQLVEFGDGSGDGAFGRLRGQAWSAAQLGLQRHEGFSASFDWAQDDISFDSAQDDISFDSAQDDISFDSAQDDIFGELGSCKRRHGRFMLIEHMFVCQADRLWRFTMDGGRAA
jgi:hypothetical protein